MSNSIILKSKKSLALSLLIIASLYSATICDRATALELPTISVTPEVTKADLNQLFSINITITNAVSIFAWELWIKYDINILVPQLPPIEGRFLKTGGFSTYLAYTSNPQEGAIRIAVTRLGEVPGASGNGILVTIKFYAHQAGDSLLHLFNTVLFNEELSEIDHTTQDGYFTIPVLGDLTGRLWSSQKHYSITRSKTGIQTLYAKVGNTGKWSSYVRAEIKITDESGQLIGVFQAKHMVENSEIKLASGESTVVSVNLWENRENSWAPNKYFAEAKCVYSAGSILWESSVTTRTLSFVIVP